MATNDIEFRAQYFNNLGIIEAKNENYQKAIDLFKKSLSIKPNPLAYINLGLVFRNQGKIKEALKLFHTALNINLHDPELLNTIGETHKKAGNFSDSIKYFSKAIELDNSNSTYYYNLGTVNHTLGHATKAEANYKKAIKLDPQREDVRAMLGILYIDFKAYDKAIEEFDKIIRINPNNDYAIRELTYISRLICDYKNFKKWSKKLNVLTKQALNQNLSLSETPFVNIVRKDDPLESLKISKYWATKIENSISNNNIFIHDKKTRRKITRLGYLTNDFGDHPVAHIIADLFSSHDRRKFKVFAYSYTKNTSNVFYEKIKKGFDKFTDINNLGHFEAAKKIYDDGVDILIDLKGFTNKSRLEICAYRPAPIQISYLGFPGTSGANFFDYTIVDTKLVPEEDRKYFSEKLIYLPHCYQVNSPRTVSKKQFTRSDFNLPKNSFVFVSFNNPIKINENVYSLWLRILERAPNSVLWLDDRINLATTNLLKIAKKKDLDKRVVFSKRIPLDEHLKRHNLANLGLDTFYYSGGATTSHAIWMNIPVITLPGASYISRMGSSIVSAAGLPELVCKSELEYENLAVNLAKNPKKMEELKEKLNRSSGKKTLFNIKEFVRNIETAYIEIWNNYKEGSKPKDTYVVRN